ncbi:YfcE family phosphodiesterase [Thermosphaera chiliense]|uniref:Phosphoesterase n=1 Tax=Thermosphaera chiliense TaxID=3402707 RepID=A0A7M1UTA5_9CREN|nr:YfcE family phosphodiesterase [Thermosphaera aggregans]QOR94004.1 YfcE family phosphodiesterase [Thermosphaera aggregans]
MTRILILGDTHIPDRAERVPKPLVRLVENGAWDSVLFTGDLTSGEVKAWVEELGENVFIVKGNMDFLPLPAYQKLSIRDYVIGLYHGHGIYPRGDSRKLAEIAKTIGASVLITGHTHVPFVKTDPSREILLLNPGSATGAWSGELESGPPSLMIVEARDGYFEIRLFKLVGGSIIEELFSAERKDKWYVRMG